MDIIEKKVYSTKYKAEKGLRIISRLGEIGEVVETFVHDRDILTGEEIKRAVLQKMGHERLWEETSQDLLDRGYLLTWDLCREICKHSDPYVNEILSNYRGIEINGKLLYVVSHSGTFFKADLTRKNLGKIIHFTDLQTKELGMLNVAELQGTSVQDIFFNN